MHRFSRLLIKCSHCGHAANMERSRAEAHLSRELTIEAVPELFKLLRCGSCGQRKVRLFDDEGQILIDHVDLVRCENCGGPILKARLAALPDSRLCTSCSAEMSGPVQPPPYPQPPLDARICPRCERPTVVREGRGGREVLYRLHVLSEVHLDQVYPEGVRHIVLAKRQSWATLRTFRNGRNLGLQHPAYSPSACRPSAARAESVPNSSMRSAMRCAGSRSCPMVQSAAYPSVTSLGGA